MKRLRITIEGNTYDVDVEILGEETEKPHRPAVTSSRSAPPPKPAAAPPPSARPAATAAAGDVPSPLSGNIISVDVSVGQKVSAGEKVITMEAMKMNTIVNSPSDGTISAIHVKAGDSVEEGRPLLTID